ncbi:MAG: DUF1987 domain-containing protein [Bacteroidota bacterium]
MENLYIPPSEVMPEITLSHKDNIFRIRGCSRPENVREMYEPVLTWLSDYKKKLITGRSIYTENNPLIFQLYLEYFNSSTVKFLFDIIMIMKSLEEEGIPIAIHWFYDPEDPDSREAGEDLAGLAEIGFKYIERQE